MFALVINRLTNGSAKKTQLGSVKLKSTENADTA